MTEAAAKRNTKAKPMRDLAAAITSAARSWKTTLIGSSTPAVHLTCDGEKLRVRSNGLRFTVEVDIPTTFPPFNAAVPPDLIERMVQLFDEDLIMGVEGGSLVLRTVDAQYRVNTLNVEHSEPIGVQDGEAVHIDRGVLHRVVDCVVPAASTDPTRSKVQNVFIAATGDAAQLRATDSYVLSALNASATGSGSFSVPASALKEALHLLDGVGGDTVTITCDKTRAEIASNSWRLITEGSANELPDEATLLRDQPVGWIEVDTDGLTRALRRLRAMVDKEQPVKITPNGASVSIETADIEKMNGVETLTAKIIGDPPVFWVNRAFLAKAVDTFTGDTITVELRDHLKPLVLTSADTDPKWLVMPVRR